jgi:hypothetical protein
MKVNATILVILWCLLGVVSTASVRDVFYGASNLKDIPCRIFQPNYGVIDLKKPLDAIQYQLRKLILDYYEETTNCTTDYGDVDDMNVKAGSMAPNGSYDGFIGMIQRNDYDMVIFGARLDLLQNDPAIIGPVIGPADTVIGVGTYNDSQVKIGVLETMNNFDNETIGFILISFYVVCIVLLIIEFSLRGCTRRRQSPLLLIKEIFDYIFETTWKLMANFLGYESFDSPFVSARLLMITAMFFNILLSSGFFKNLVKSDMTSVRPAKQINSMEDLLTDEFKSIQPVYIKQLYMAELLKLSKTDTFNRLRNRIALNKSFSELDMNFDRKSGETFGILIKYTDLIAKHQAAILLPGLGIEIMHKFLCSFFPEKLGELRLARNRFAGGLFVHLFSKKIDPRIRKFLHYQMITVAEMAIYPGLEKFTVSQDFYYADPSVDPVTRSRCEFLRKTEKKQNEVVAYTLENFIVPLYKVLGNVYAYCFVVFIFEFMFYHVNRSMKHQANMIKQEKKQKKKEMLQNPRSSQNIRKHRNGVISEFIVKQNILIVYNPATDDDIQVIGQHGHLVENR